jgi:diketogulonate reductase-like aldo/keto reductase
MNVEGAGGRQATDQTHQERHMTGTPRTATLLSGTELPLLGFGTYQLHDAEARQAIQWALEAGYRHFDTATSYENEADLGRALADSGVDRSELFVTSKLPLRCVGAERETIEQSLEFLRTDHLDLWLMHWPPADELLVPTWQAMVEARDAGLVTSIGVSNFSIDQIDAVAAATDVVPEVNQLRWNPFLFDREAFDRHRERGIVITAYTPFRRARLDDPVLTDVAAAVGATPAQVIVKWHLLRDTAVLARSARRERIVENVDVEGFTLSREQMLQLDARAGIYTFD